MTISSFSITLGELAERIGGELHGKAEHVIYGVNTLTDASSQQISFLDNPKYQPQLLTTQAGAVILAKKDLAECPTAAIVVDNPYVCYAKVAQLFWRKPAVNWQVHPTAIVDPSVTLPQKISIGPYAVIGRNVHLAENCIIGAHCIIGDDCSIGENSELMPRVTLYHACHIGARCVIHSGVVIGSDGFGFAPQQGKFEKIPQIGGVRIGDDVEIGANTTIDRGALTDTIIEEGVKLDNQIQLGHNVRIGANTVIAGCTGVAGSTTIGKNCMIGGAVGIAGHIKIADQVMLTGMAMVTHSINAPGVYASGTGLLPRQEWQKCVVRFRHLNELAKKITSLEQRILTPNDEP